MAFDDDYRREVLEPARAAGDRPPEDLRVRYALTGPLAEPLTGAVVAARVKQVRQCWRRARGQLKYRKLIDRLEAEHRELAPLFAAAERGDPRPLDARLRGGRERTERRRDDARARLADAAGTLRMATPAEVDGIARAGGVTRAELERAAAADGVEIREPDPLPSTAPYPAYRKVQESLDVLGHRHLADFVFGERLVGPFRILDGFAAPGGNLSLDRDAVATAAAGWARRGRDTSTTHADTILAALRSDAPLPELLLFDVADRLRERLRQRASEQALLRYAVDDLGVDRRDARRLVFSVVRETGPGGGGLAGRLRALLDAGEVFAAAELADAATVPPPPAGGEPAEEEVLAAEARHRLDTALRLRETAAAEPDPDRAHRLLDDALRLVRDLPGALNQQRRLPPRPVPAVRADVDGGGDGGAVVRVSWDPSPSTAGEVTYRVVRRAARAPRTPTDGHAVEGAVDERPPVNAPVYYGVFAVRGDAAAAPAVVGPVVVRPEPAEVELVAGDGQVTGRWRCPAEAARVVVVRDGAPVPAGRDGFRERVPNGRTHHYRVAAVYLDPSGREVETDGVRTSVTPSAPPEPVYELDAEVDGDDPGLVRVRFDPPGNGAVELVLSPGPPPWPRSALVPLEEVRRETRRLACAPVPGGLEVRPGAGGWLLAVSVAEGGAAIGAYHRHVNLPPPRRLVADRRGDHVHVGFDWPPDVAEVDVVYQVGGDALHGSESSSTRTVTRAAYDTQGGIRLPVPEDEPVALSVAAAGTVGGSRVTGPPVTARVAARAVVRYDVLRSGPPWRRSLTIRLTSSRPLRVARLSLVLRAGRVMPHRAADGETLGAWEQVPVPGELSLAVPDASRPYWLRCFADDDVVELADPPVRTLQVTR
ncbi:hypothetical protein D0T12_24880 [Actinomadura spongiicola]|uniref:Fibronectin type-III domain-containing protein n=1 Tax=Actinomadura spongiicola TaxID=2303421 RepID=A0A372GC92_9ACTN|nr:hypothetical protein [Actinomadura spongiicola]RFS82683.1 hypothetical protein D0T12_24880 [Actinomadura spongiicola]